MSLISHVNEDTIHKLGTDVVTKYYANDVTNVKQFPIIPSPSLFDFEEPPPSASRAPAPSSSTASTISANDAQTTGDHRLPNVAECATHLCFLQVLYVIRQKILVSTEIDTSLDIKKNREVKTGKKGDTKTFKDDTWWKRRQVKWDYYIEFAVVRFLTWADSVDSDRGEHFVKKSGAGYIVQTLPPLDVLMVWHSFLLNPRVFRETRGEQVIYQTRFPWKAIHKAITTEDWSFKQPASDALQFENRLWLHGDLFQAFEEWHKPIRPRGTTTDWKTIPLKEFTLTTAPSNFERRAETVGQKFVLTSAAEFANVAKVLARDLKDAVYRQSSFVDKMNAHIWIRSPAVRGTLRRAILRYNNFLKLLALNTPAPSQSGNALTAARPPPSSTLVPTLDIDLAWHTHQTFSGALYFGGMKARVGRFINHDDTIGKGELGDGYGETRKLWRARFAGEYKVCGCWDCEAVIEGVENLRDRKKAGGDDASGGIKAIAAQASQDVSVYRLAEVRRRKKHDVPTESIP